MSDEKTKELAKFLEGLVLDGPLDLITLLALPEETEANYLASFEDWAKDVAFVGFKPLAFVKNLLEIAKNHTPQRALVNDMRLLCLLTVLRGTKINRMTGKMSPAGVEKVNALRDVYTITDLKPKTGLDVTLGRIASCFPTFIADLLHSMREVELTGLSLPGAFRVCCFPGAGAMFDPKQDFVAFSMWLLWCVAFAKTIGAKPPMNDGWKYQKIVVGSGLVSSAKKVAFATKYGLENSEDTINTLSHVVVDYWPLTAFQVYQFVKRQEPWPSKKGMPWDLPATVEDYEGLVEESEEEEEEAQVVISKKPRKTRPATVTPAGGIVGSFMKHMAKTKPTKPTK